MSFLDDPASIITQFFPKGPYNFEGDEEPGPLKKLFGVSGQRIAQYSADVLLLQSQMSVQTAAGRYLDLHGAFYGISRKTVPTFELDDGYRARILAGTKKLTIPALQAAVDAYYVSLRPDGPRPAVYVYDRQSDPTRAAAVDLQRYQFVIDVDFPIRSSYGFFAGRAFLGRHDFLINPSAISDQPSDPFLAAIVRRTKAANTEPVWRTHSHFVRDL